MIRRARETEYEEVKRWSDVFFGDPYLSLEEYRKYADEPDGFLYVAEEEGEIIGCVVYRNIVGDVDITNVQVKEAHRGRGTGAALMKAAMDEARKSGGLRFTLEVRESNKAAIALYKSLGFKAEGIRRGFYEHPREDAVIMWL